VYLIQIQLSKDLLIPSNEPLGGWGVLGDDTKIIGWAISNKEMSWASEAFCVMVLVHHGWKWPEPWSHAINTFSALYNWYNMTMWLEGLFWCYNSRGGLRAVLAWILVHHLVSGPPKSCDLVQNLDLDWKSDRVFWDWNFFEWELNWNQLARTIRLSVPMGCQKKSEHLYQSTHYTHACMLSLSWWTNMS